MARNQPTLFEDIRLSLDAAIELSLQALRAYGSSHDHWAVAYSGGKDSSAAATFTAWAIRSGRIDPPKSLTVLYADTGMELPPLQSSALKLIDSLRSHGFQTRIVMPEMDERFYVYMLGRGVPPPKNRFRWCTPQIKVEPMENALQDLRRQSGEKLLMLTGVRLGESAARDQRIALSCSRDSGECGQGWYQRSSSDAIADTLAPLVHWRLCHVYDWLYFDDRHGYDVSGIAAIYGEDEVRTGCVGCNLASRDTALERLLAKHPAEWGHLRPLLELKPLYRELTQARWRKRKSEPEKLKDGSYGKNVQRLGPLTMPARRMGLEKVLDIQNRSGVTLITAEEEARIRELWALNTWPRKWSEDDIDGQHLIDKISVENGRIITQSLLV